jgi:hypothetical protein
MLSISSLESLKSFCCEKNRMALHRQVLERANGVNGNTIDRCRNPSFIGDSQHDILILLHDLYYHLNQSKVKPKDLIYAGIARNGKVAWVYIKRLRELCVVDKDNNINIERVEELLRLPVRMISRGIKRSRSQGSRRCR